MSEKVTKLIEEVKSLSVLELSELSKALEEEFGVTAAAPVAMMAGPAAQANAAPAQQEKTEFNVVLKSVGSSKIQVVKAVKEFTGLGLKESKDLVDNAPKVLKENVAKNVAEETVKKFADIGAEVVME